LPLEELNELELLDNSELITGWLDNEHLKSDKRKELNTIMYKKH
jgi:hypothetical protein